MFLGLTKRRAMEAALVMTLAAVAVATKLNDGAGIANMTYAGTVSFTVTTSGGHLIFNGVEYDWDSTLTPPGYARGATPKTIIRFSGLSGDPNNGSVSMDNEGSGNIDSGTYSHTPSP